MKIRYKGRRARDVVPATGKRPFTVKPGEVVDVDDKTARSLLDQPGWFERAADPAKKTAEKKETD